MPSKYESTKAPVRSLYQSPFLWTLCREQVFNAWVLGRHLIQTIAPLSESWVIFDLFAHGNFMLMNPLLVLRQTLIMCMVGGSLSVWARPSLHRKYRSLGATYWDTVLKTNNPPKQTKIERKKLIYCLVFRPIEVTHINWWNRIQSRNMLSTCGQFLIKFVF